ncbi:30S ribosomal protein S9 [PVC group bacterium (ex Bugula neritina AB1)]|nr:30S ribosomal protein S9 [PVC group bacterium (ex Bugula neritina AB1)]
MSEIFRGTGRRKTSTARVAIQEGTGQFLINGRSLDEYFSRTSLNMIIHQPLELTEHKGKLDITANIKGGGKSGQAGALRHGITRALLNMDPSLRPSLKKAGFITRDSRMKESKHYGHKKARKSFQFSKR